jgi:Ca2+-binding RTX toxin-like protein
VEKLQLIGDAVEGTGNELRNVILGNDGANVLRGEGGDDSLYGRAGDDRLYGGAGDDALDGGEGDDVLMGGGGRDELEGGAGADEFEFADARHSVGAARDRIVDFDAGEGDTIDLTRIDADARKDGHQSFVYVGNAAFSGAAGELRFADGLLVGDVDGDGAADFEVEMEGVAALGNDDLLL